MLIDIILFRWENKLDISTNSDMYIKDIMKENINKYNNENIIEKINNIVNDELVVNI